MARTSRQIREQARLLFLSGQQSSNAAIARQLRVKPHTIGGWRRLERWDELKLKADRRAAEKLVEQLATDRAELNVKHFKLWEALLSRAVSMLKDESSYSVKGLEQISNILQRAQQGQRLARELSTATEAEEKARLQAAADLRAFVDLFITAVKEHVTDEDTREKLRQEILGGLPTEQTEGAGEPDGESLQ